MPSPHPAQAARRGSLSARQWQEARQWARLARSEGVEINWRGNNNVSFKPLGSARAEPQAPPVSRPREAATPRSTAQPMDTGDAAVLTKKQQRDATRRLEFRTKKRIECWQRLTSSVLRRSRWQAGQDIFSPRYTAFYLLAPKPCTASVVVPVLPSFPPLSALPIGPTAIRTRDLSICSRPPYHLATDP